jgi:ABC-type phosphate transport system permease subunit
MTRSGKRSHRPVTGLSRWRTTILREVPDGGAIPLGATRWETVRRAVIPVARSGIVGAIILGLGPGARRWP